MNSVWSQKQFLGGIRQKMYSGKFRKIKSTVKTIVADIDKKGILPWLIRTSWFLFSCYEKEQAPACLKHMPACLNRSQFSFKKYLNLFKSPVRNSYPPIKTDEHLFSKIAYSKFSLDIWSLFLTSLSLVYFFIYFCSIKTGGRLFQSRQAPIITRRVHHFKINVRLF